MQGYLIYDKEGIERNRWFADELISAAKSHGIALALIIHEKGEPFFPEDGYAFAISRVIDPELTLFLQNKGLRVFNNYKTSFYANSKWNTFLLAKKLSVNTMDTYLPQSYPELKKAFPEPLILKALDGHGGKQVFSVKSDKEYTEAVKKLSGREYLLQKCCSEVGVDVRVYCLGERILTAVKRSSATDFRSNFSLGGSAEPFTPTQDMINTVKLLYDELRFDLVGVDFIRHNGKYILNEIEDVVGTRMIYKLGDIDPVQEYIRYIYSSLFSK